MHIGGMRTALFVWLWARHTGGTFILRIDDTDQERNVAAALGPILRAFAWLGLDVDEGPDPNDPTGQTIKGSHGPYYQSQRTAIYRAAVEKLLAEGKAFRDFDTPEQTQADRQQAEALKQPFVNIRRSLNLTPEQGAAFVAENKPHVVRFLIPRDQKVAIDDAVRGHVEWDCATMPDPVIMRSNGGVLYNFATVVDDASLEITHVIRAEEHLTNTALQALVFDALGYERPTFAHIPFITAPGSSKKLSKRDLEKLRSSPKLKKMFDRADEVFPKLGLGDSKSLNPVMVEYYEKLGYLPDAIFNALSRFGWSLDDKTEIMSRQTVIENFTLDRIVKSAAGFDTDKLQSIQAHWMNQLSVADKLAGCWPYLVQAGLVAADSTKDHVKRVIGALGERLKLFSDILDYDEFFKLDQPVQYDNALLAQKFTDLAEAKTVLLQLANTIAAIEPFDAQTLDRELHLAVEALGRPMNQLIQPLRVALTGKTSGISLFDTLALLGKQTVVERLQTAAG